MGKDQPECGAKLMAQSGEFQCIRCGRVVEGYETALFSGMRICSECYYESESGRRCARCFRKLESWQGRTFSDGNEYCELCFLLVSERSARKGGALGEQFAFN
jgi:predicted amidophosphoribosyltransferase